MVRDGARGVEVLLVRRGGGSPFMPGATVFPGGKVDAADDRGGGLQATLCRAVARELAEEVGLDIGDTAPVCFAHWLTPAAEPRRFDTWFFAVRAPDGQTPRCDRHETTELSWSAPAAALAAHAAWGPVWLPPPTQHTLARFAAIGGDVAHLIEVLGREGPGPLICPYFEPTAATGPTIALPWDPLHPDVTPFLARHAGELGAMTAVAPDLGRGPVVDRFTVRRGRLMRETDGDSFVMSTI